MEIKLRKIFIFCFLQVLLFWPVHSRPGLLTAEQKQDGVSLQHEVAVTLKLIQVYVTDKNGKPLSNLAASDFGLYDNGKQMRITEFEKHVLPPRLEVPEAETETSVPPSSRMNRKFFLFFDFVFNNPQGLEQAKKAALHFLDTELNGTDEVGILSYSIHNGLTLHEYLTSDHRQSERSSKALESKSSWAGLRMSRSNTGMPYEHSRAALRPLLQKKNMPPIRTKASSKSFPSTG
jgi:VWFA-related protein